MARSLQIINNIDTSSNTLMHNDFANINTRQQHLDTVGGFLIIVVVVWHCFQWCGFEAYMVPFMKFFSFCMPWFLYKGGMFSKQKKLTDVLARSYRRLILPYIVYSIIGLFAYCLYSFAVERTEFSFIGCLSFQFGLFVQGGSVYGNLPLWFFVALVGARILFSVILNLINYSNQYLKYLGYIILILSILLPVVSLFTPHMLFPRWISYIFMATAYYAAGYYLGKIKLDLPILIFMFLAYTAIIVIYPTWYDLFTCRLICGNILFWYPQSLLGILAINGISKLLSGNLSILVKLGQNTLPIFCLHWIIIEVMVAGYQFINIDNNYIMLSVLLLANITLLPIFIKAMYHSKYKSVLI